MAKTKFFETDSFKKQKKEWYAKLRNEGFDDIEEGETEGLIQPQKFSAGKGVDYYQFCQSVLRDYSFKRDLDRAVFELHADGKTHREIAEWLKAHSFKALHYTNVGKLIDRIKEDFLKMKS